MENSMSIDQASRSERVVVVTGAASGIGWAISSRFASEGCAVVLVDRNEAVEGRASELRERGASAWPVITDLTDRAAVASATDRILAEHGRCDVLVNNAGNHVKSPEGQRYRFDEAGLREWDFSIALHMTAPLLLCQAFLPGMKERRWGRIINMSSRAGRTYVSQASVYYAASKAGLAGLTRSIAGEYAPFGITCNAVAPGRVSTPLSARSAADVLEFSRQELPVGRFGVPGEVAETVRFLASEEAAFITGAIVDVNGGGFMAP